MFKGFHEPLVPRAIFLTRISRYAAVCALLGAFLVGIGMVGCHTMENQPWPETLLNAAMLLGAMGPTGDTATEIDAAFAADWPGSAFAHCRHRLTVAED